MLQGVHQWTQPYRYGIGLAAAGPHMRVALFRRSSDCACAATTGNIEEAGAGSDPALRRRRRAGARLERRRREGSTLADPIVDSATNVTAEALIDESSSQPLGEASGSDTAGTPTEAGASTAERSHGGRLQASAAATAPRARRRRRGAARLRVPPATTPDDVIGVAYDDADADSTTSAQLPEALEEEPGGEDAPGGETLGLELLLADLGWEEEGGESEDELEGPQDVRGQSEPAAADKEGGANDDAMVQGSAGGGGAGVGAAARPGSRRNRAGLAAEAFQTGSSEGSASRDAGSSGSVGGGQAGPKPRPEALRLTESSPMFVPVLTDEDLAADPPGHRSGYVAVIGKPNAGKSTLINAVVGQKLSIVTAKPQTTRHRIVGIASDTEYQMILFDTPGIMRQQRHKLDQRMMAAVVASIKAAEAIVAVVDAADDPRDALSMFQPGPDWSGPPMAVLINKADLVEPGVLEELVDWYRTNCRAEAVFVGRALDGSADEGVCEVKKWAVSRLPEGPTLYPKSQVSEQPERFFVAEVIREQVFLQYEQEVPYATQVLVAEFKERPGAKDYILAHLLVERPSQKGIILGADGQALKKLSRAARAAVEEFLERPVYLEIRVEVAPDWRQQSEQLRDFGFYDPLYIT